MHRWTRPVTRVVAWFVLPVSPSVAQVESPPEPVDLQAYNVILRKQMNTHPGASDVWGYTSPGGVELAIWGYQTGTSFVDATDPANAAEVFDLPGPYSIWRDIKTYQHYAYVVTEGAGAGTGLQIVDLSDPLVPVHVSTYTANGFATAHNIWIDTDAGIAYACGAPDGMHVLSLADPENPVQLDVFSPYYIHDLYVGDGRGYAGAINSGTLRILDTSDPSNLVTLATHAYPGAATHAAWPSLDGTHVVTADETPGGHVQIWDITDLSNIQFVSELFSGQGVVHNVLGVDDLLYCSWYTSGTRIFDITNPADPIEVGFYDTSERTGSGYNGNWGVYPFRGDGILYSTDRQEGLFLLEFTGGFAGEIQGIVRDGATSLPIAGADVRLLDTPIAFLTPEDGTYGGRMSSGAYSVIVSRFAYVSDTTTVGVPPFDVLAHDVDLVPKPVGTVVLTVSGAVSGAPVEGARVEVLGTPLTGLSTDAQGQVELVDLPAGEAWTVTIDRFGWVSREIEVLPTAGGTNEVTLEMTRGFRDDFERDQAWISGHPGDTATDGLWERAIPLGSFFNGIVGPDEDASPDGAGWAYVTEQPLPGSFVGTSDVDGGQTTLLTPVFDGTGLGDLSLTYTRWFSNRAPVPSTDEFRCDVSTDGGATWTNLETIAEGTDAWAQVIVDLSAVISPTSQMQLRFVAEDLGDNTYVEAGLDDVSIVTGATASPGSKAEAPPLLALRGLGPNPFRSATSFAFELPAPGRAALEVFDISGRRVVTLLGGERVAAGRHRVPWDGRDGTGAVVAPGLYFVQLTTGAGTASRKVTFVR